MSLIDQQKTDADLDPAQGGYADPNWKNPGRCASEWGFFERNRARLRAQHGLPPESPAPFDPQPLAGILGAIAGSMPPQTRPVQRPPSGQGSEQPKRKTYERRGYRRKRSPEFAVAGSHRRPIDRNMRAKIIYLAEATERSTKAKGKQKGAISQNGLAILRVLLFKFLGRDGWCIPSYDAIQQATGFCRETIARALVALERCGFVAIINRLIRTKVISTCGFTGKPIEAVRVVQTSNAYLFKLPALAANAFGFANDAEPATRFPERRQKAFVFSAQDTESETQRGINPISFEEKSKPDLNRLFSLTQEALAR